MKWRLVFLGTLLVVILALVLRTCSTPPNQGKKLYTEHCSNCHGDLGQGLKGAIPPLSKAALTEYKPSFVCIIQHGMVGPIKVDGVQYNDSMPGNHGLSAVQIANITDYVYSTFHGEQSLSLTEVEGQLQNCE